MGSRIKCGSSMQQSNRVMMQKVWFIPVFCSSGLFPVEAALRTLSQQEHLGWPWLKHTSDTIPLS